MYLNNIEVLYKNYETVKEEISFFEDIELYNINYFNKLNMLQNIIDNIEDLSCVSFEKLKAMDWGNR